MFIGISVKGSHKGDAIDQSDTEPNRGVDDGLPLVRGESDLEQVTNTPFGSQSENSVGRNNLHL
jgi:hypothetical protein